MKASLEKFPTGVPYIGITPPGNWHVFPEFARKLLGKIKAGGVYDVSRGQVIDCHWYEFEWSGGKFRLIYEDWPHQITVETIEKEGRLDGLLAQISETLSKLDC